MKIIFAFAILFVTGSTFAQQDMFWNNYSNINPSMSGFQYKQHGAISYSDYFHNYRPKNLQANYNMRLGGKHGLGVNFTQSNFALNQSSAVLNYNYQFDLGSKGKLSAGIGAGLNYVDENKSNNFFEEYDVKSKTYFQLNLGVAYKWRQLTAGVSLRNLTQPEVILDSGLVLHTRPSLNIHAEYDFKIGKQFQLTPRLIYGPIVNQHRLKLGLELTYKNKFSFGIISDFNNEIGFHLAWDINEKFRVAYMYTAPFSSLTSNQHIPARHQITLGFKIP